MADIKKYVKEKQSIKEKISNQVIEKAKGITPPLIFVSSPFKKAICNKLEIKTSNEIKRVKIIPKKLEPNTLTYEHKTLKSSFKFFNFKVNFNPVENKIWGGNDTNPNNFNIVIDEVLKDEKGYYKINAYLYNATDKDLSITNITNLGIYGIRLENIEVGSVIPKNQKITFTFSILTLLGLEKLNGSHITFLLSNGWKITFDFYITRNYNIVAPLGYREPYNKVYRADQVRFFNKKLNLQEVVEVYNEVVDYTITGQNKFFNYAFWLPFINIYNPKIYDENGLYRVSFSFESYIKANSNKSGGYMAVEGLDKRT